MLTIRVETLAREGCPFRPAQYSMYQAEHYFVVHEQFNPEYGHYVDRPAGEGEEQSEVEQKNNPWRTRIEVYPPQTGKDPEKDHTFFIYIEKGYIDRVFVMNDAGKTVDTIT